MILSNSMLKRLYYRTEVCMHAYMPVYQIIVQLKLAKLAGLTVTGELHGAAEAHEADLAAVGGDDDLRRSRRQHPVDAVLKAVGVAGVAARGLPAVGVAVPVAAAELGQARHLLLLR